MEEKKGPRAESRRPRDCAGAACEAGRTRARWYLGMCFGLEKVLVSIFAIKSSKKTTGY